MGRMPSLTINADSKKSVASLFLLPTVCFDDNKLIKPNEIPIFELNDALGTLSGFSIGVVFDIDDVQAIIINDMIIKNN